MTHSNPAARPRICLNMIVKNESAIIERCLDSVLPLIDAWVIVDTGSTDGTQDIIRKKLAHLPGELHERPWVNFGHNRSEAAALAQDRPDKAVYLLFFDADDLLERPADFVLPELTADAYRLWLSLHGTRYTRTILVSTRLRWRWVGVVHEYPAAEPPESTIETLQGLQVQSSVEGARSRDPQKYCNDAALLEKALADDSSNTRNVFYLAQSYRDAGETQKALTTYLRRAAMGGWAEEQWCALWQAARMAEKLQRPWPEVTDRYLTAFQARPQRVEPLVDLARAERERSQFARAYLFASVAMRFDWPKQDILFVDESAYQWRRQDELSIAAYWIGRYQESLDLCNYLLESDRTPPLQRERIEMNRKFAADKLLEINQSR